MGEIVGNQAVKLARVASGMNQSQAAELLDISLPTYAAREKLPRSFTVMSLMYCSTVLVMRVRSSSAVLSAIFFCNSM